MSKKEEMQENNSSLTTIDKLPNLHEAKTSPRELSSTYWTPDNPGEYKVGVVLEIKQEKYENESGETIDLPCVIMLSQEQDGSFNTIRNGSKRLVATILDAIESGEVVFTKTPVRITYAGKVRNKTNAYSSDRWSVKPILV